jgi:hypothetical protein
MIDFPENKYFHCYATANDDRFYYRDIQNLLRIKNTDPGVTKIQLYVAISEVEKINSIDRTFIWAVKKLFYQHPSIVLKKIFFKTNIGRDFSSYSIMNYFIKDEAAPDDYVFFQNRSGYGPFREGWLNEIILQYKKFDRTAICGSTINFRDHPNRSQKKDLPHVQTYAFLTKILFLEKLGNFFPGAKESSRLEIILQGEIGLSQFFIRRGFGITCMEWPDEYINNESKPINNKDIKDSVAQSHQFYHKVFLNKPENVLRNTFKKLNLFLILLINGFFTKMRV